jgi:hypothetical protein
MTDERADGRAVDAAFNRVLRAEAEARAALADCRAQADARVTAAEQAARAIAGRAERRIRAAHRIADRGIERALADLATDGNGGEAPAAPDAAVVEALAAALAAELTAELTAELPPELIGGQS